MPTSRNLKEILSQHLAYYDKVSQNTYGFIKTGDLDRGIIIEKWKELLRSCEHESYDEIKPIFVLLLLVCEYCNNNRNPRLIETVNKFITQEKASLPNYFIANNTQAESEPNHHIIDLLRSQINTLGNALALANHQKRQDRNALEKENHALKLLVTGYKETLNMNLQALHEAHSLIKDYVHSGIDTQFISHIDQQLIQLQALKDNWKKPEICLSTLNEKEISLKNRYCELQKTEITLQQESQLLNSLLSNLKETQDNISLQNITQNKEVANNQSIESSIANTNVSCKKNSTVQVKESHHDSKQTIPHLTTSTTTQVIAAAPPPPPPPPTAKKTTIPAPPPPPPPKTNPLIEQPTIKPDRTALFAAITDPNRPKLKPTLPSQSKKKVI